MIVYLIAMLVILVVAAGVAGMVMVGIEGRRLERYPRLAEFLTRAAQHLNGEAEPSTQPSTQPSMTPVQPVTTPERRRVREHV